MKRAIYIRNGFLLAGLINILGPTLASSFFTDPTLSTIDPGAFSTLGLIIIMIWGLAYWSVANRWQQVTWLVAVFALEKLVFAFYWLSWVVQPGIDVASIFAESLLVGLFYSSYGPLDGLISLFFFVVFLKARQARSNTS